MCVMHIFSLLVLVEQTIWLIFLGSDLWCVVAVGVGSSVSSAFVLQSRNGAGTTMPTSPPPFNVVNSIAHVAVYRNPVSQSIRMK